MQFIGAGRIWKDLDSISLPTELYPDSFTIGVDVVYFLLLLHMIVVDLRDALITYNECV